MSTVAKIFRESEGPRLLLTHETWTRLYSLEEFVQSLHSERHFKFEAVLRPRRMDKSAGWQPRVHEVFRALKWLHLRGVRKIIRLKVLERIAEVVGEFEVAALDWGI
ncbi:hypothetical protein B0I35DRAFT_481201 [Stachybotrys elegans]|uniref:Uncharacterized protein n=1 Tax=Stachybotrys elegans TaxID=80388 RepID=A0A8K0SKX5_9HYPO|nr:hypothetical protein B0I35DRAFT_481201 [Stachybotrys elegans]